MKKQWRKGKLKDKDLFKGSYRELLFYSELEYTQYQDFRMKYIYFAFNSGNFFSNQKCSVQGVGAQTSAAGATERLPRCHPCQFLCLQKSAPGFLKLF